MTAEAAMHATGRRKTSVAAVRMAAGTGSFTVNGRPVEDYFPQEDLRLVIRQPLVLTGSEGKYDIAAVVRGGGLVGQAGALRHGLARALSQTGDEARHALKGAGLLTRDQRMKERKKYGRPGARKRFQFSKR
ncbi:MAG: 30S ribosomal protein S9 [bacterium]|nr:30S ribosomal protein S9 [bacterium]